MVSKFDIYNVFKQYQCIVIGNLASRFSVPRIYDPPVPPSYKHSRDITMLTTIEGFKVASKTFYPFSIEATPRSVQWIIFSHGNADDVGTCSSYCQWLADSLNVNVITYDYPSYGMSDRDEMSVSGMHLSIEAVYGYCVASLNIPPANIYLMGKSLGSVPTVYLAAQDFAQEISGVILVSPLASGVRVLLGMKRLPEQIMDFMDTQFAPNIKIIQRVRCPVFLVHGTNDDIIHVQNSHDLFEKLPSRCVYSPLWVEASHNDIESLHRGLFISSMSSFLDHCKNKLSSDDYI